MRILVEPSGAVLAERATIARTLPARLKGLLGRRQIREGEAMVFPQCRSIHTIGMRVPIDAIFVDRAWRVVGLRAGLGPWRVVCPVWSAWGVVEMAQGTLSRIRLQVGDQLNLLQSSG